MATDSIGVCRLSAETVEAIRVVITEPVQLELPVTLLFDSGRISLKLVQLANVVMPALQRRAAAEARPPQEQAAQKAADAWIWQ